MAVYIQAQSKSKDVQFKMEVTWEKERAEHKRLLEEAQRLALDLQVGITRNTSDISLNKK